MLLVDGRDVKLWQQDRRIARFGNCQVIHDDGLF